MMSAPVTTPILTAARVSVAACSPSWRSARASPSPTSITSSRCWPTSANVLRVRVGDGSRLHAGAARLRHRRALFRSARRHRRSPALDHRDAGRRLDQSRGRGGFAIAAVDSPSAMFFVGTFSVTPQMFVPFAAHLAAPESRGRALGRRDERPARRHSGLPRGQRITSARRLAGERCSTSRAPSRSRSPRSWR